VDELSAFALVVDKTYQLQEFPRYESKSIATNPTDPFSAPLITSAPEAILVTSELSYGDVPPAESRIDG
jgi:hypothetical protein